MAVIKGNNKGNVLTGGKAKDNIDGRGGDDKIDGMGGDDRISGQGGDDRLTGGSGNDTFVFSNSRSNNGFDTITDYHWSDSKKGEKDVLDLSAVITKVGRGGKISDYVWLVEGSGGATLYIDPDGAGGKCHQATPWALLSGLDAGDLVRIRIGDKTHCGGELTLTVGGGGGNDPAVITGPSSGAVTEASGVANGTPGTPTATGDLLSTDSDNPNDAFQTVVAGSGTTNSYGTYGVTATGVWTYTLNNANAAVQALNTGSTLVDSFTVLSADGTAKVVNITINGANDAAVITGTSTGTVTEDGTLQASADLAAADVDNPADVFQAVAPGAVTTYGTYGVSAAGVWTYSLNNANAAVQALNTGDSLADSFTVFSADGTAKVVNITINGANEPADPAVISGPSSGAVTEASGVANGTPGTPTATGDLWAERLSNPDDVFTSVAAGAGTTNGYGTYGVTAAGVWTYTLNNANAAVQALNTSGSLTDTFTVYSAEGTGQLVTITINGANDAAVITGTSTGTVTEDGTLTASADLLATDVDNLADVFQAVAPGAVTTYGTYGVTAAGVWTYALNNANAAVQALNTGDSLADSFTVFSADGTAKVVNITINGVNEPPPGNFDVNASNQTVDCAPPNTSVTVKFYDTFFTNGTDTSGNTITHFKTGPNAPDDHLDFSNYSFLTGGVEQGGGGFAAGIAPIKWYAGNFGTSNTDISGKVVLVDTNVSTGADTEAEILNMFNSSGAVVGSADIGDILSLNDNTSAFVIAGGGPPGTTAYMYYVYDPAGGTGDTDIQISLIGTITDVSINAFDTNNFIFAP